MDSTHPHESIWLNESPEAAHLPVVLRGGLPKHNVSVLLQESRLRRLLVLRVVGVDPRVAQNDELLLRHALHLLAAARSRRNRHDVVLVTGCLPR